MNNSEKIQILKDEYLHLQNIIESFDGRAVTIKAWSITFSLTAIAGAFASHSSAVLLLASISTALFWIIEGMWKSFQNAHYERCKNIENYFSGKTKDIVPLQIGTSWYKKWENDHTKKLFRIMLWPHVCLPHIFIFLLGIIIYALSALKLVTI